MRIREWETVRHVHITINIHIKVATAPVMFSLFTVKCARLLFRQSGVALYLPDFTVYVPCVVAAGETHTL